MNKIASSLLFAAGVSFVASAQDAAVNFQNNVFKTGNPPVNDPLYKVTDASGNPLKNAEGGTTAYVAQLYLVNGGSLTPIGTPSNFRAFTTSDNNAGTWQGGLLSIPGVADGATVTLQIGVWDSMRGGSVDQVLNFDGLGQAGWSAQFTYVDPLVTDLRPDGNWMHEFRGFSLTQDTIVPEPSTYALAALGIGGLLLLRRKN